VRGPEDVFAGSRLPATCRCRRGKNGDGWGKVAKAGESWENDGNATETQLPPVLLSVAVAPSRRKTGSGVPLPFPL